MAADMTQTKLRHDVTPYENATCHTRVYVRACINNEIGPFSRFLLSHYEHTCYIITHSPEFLTFGTIFLSSYA